MSGTKSTCAPISSAQPSKSRMPRSPIRMFSSSANWRSAPPADFAVEPPASWPRSSSTTFVMPRRASWNAVEAPTEPPPMMTTSADSTPGVSPEDGARALVPLAERPQEHPPHHEPVGQPPERAVRQPVGDAVGEQRAALAREREQVLVPPAPERAGERHVDHRRRLVDDLDADAPVLREGPRQLAYREADLVALLHRLRCLDRQHALAAWRDPRRVARVEVEGEDVRDRCGELAAEGDLSHRCRTFVQCYLYARLPHVDYRRTALPTCGGRRRPRVRGALPPPPRSRPQRRAAPQLRRRSHRRPDPGDVRRGVAGGGDVRRLALQRPH